MTGVQTCALPISHYNGTDTFTFTANDGTVDSATASVAITVVVKVTPTLTWATPADLVYGTALSATQLNATASVAGTFVYTPAAGTVLNAGAAQTLSVTFTPTDTANHTTATTTVAITVTKAIPTISWATPADLTYGAALSATQLNATASVPGTFAYSPTAGTVLNAAAGQTLSVTFTPTDAANYTTATASVLITVIGVPTVTLGATSGTAGGTVTATIANAPGTPGDWVGLYDANGTPVQWQYLNGTQTLPAAGVTSATVTFILPATPGTYHARLFNATYTLVATSATITTTVPSVTLGATTGTAGGTVTATVANAPGTPGDWVGLYDANGTPVQWQYLNGSHSLPAVGVSGATVTFTLPTPGTYQVRLFNGTYTLVAISQTIAVF